MKDFLIGGHPLLIPLQPLVRHWGSMDCYRIRSLRRYPSGRATTRVDLPRVIQAKPITPRRSSNIHVGKSLNTDGNGDLLLMQRMPLLCLFAISGSKT